MEQQRNPSLERKEKRYAKLHSLACARVCGKSWESSLCLELVTMVTLDVRDVPHKVYAVACIYCGLAQDGSTKIFTNIHTLREHIDTHSRAPILEDQESLTLMADWLQQPAVAVEW